MDVRRWVAAGLLVPLLGLAGCDGDSKADPQDPTTSAAPSPSSSETAPSIPPEAKGTDEDSAKAFVDFYFAALSSAMKDGNTVVVTQLSEPNCQTCKSVAGRISNIYTKGGSLRTKGWIVEKAVTEKVDEPRRALALRVRQSKNVLLDEKGQVVSRAGTVRTPMRIELQPAAGSWRVARLDVVT